MAESAPDPKPAKKMSPGDQFWETYLNVAEEEDKFLPGSWEANTGGILTFTGLFAATVAAFLIESYKSLSPDSGEDTVNLLRQLLAASVNASAQIPVNLAPSKPFQVTSTAIAVNSLWFLSLLISLVCALLSTLIQEWARDYRRDVAKRRTVNESAQRRAFTHIYVRMGIDRYGMDQAVYMVTTLVHLSVLLFAIGLVIFLFPINSVVACITIVVLVVFLIAYAVASVMPLFDRSCPYRTPLTYPCAAFCWLLWVAVNAIFCEGPGFTPAEVIQDLTERRASSFWFLKSSRFAFAWNRTSPHIMGNQEQFKNVLASLDCIIRDNDINKSDQFAHLWSDGYFFPQLKDWGVSYLNLDTRSGQCVDFGHFQVFATLFHGMFVFDPKDLDRHEINASNVDYVLSALSQIRHISEHSDNSEERYMARLCILNAIDHYLEARVLARKQGIQVPDIVPVPQQDKYISYRHYYHSRDLLHPSFHSSWLPTDLVPLHDGNCCNFSLTLLDGVELHVAASNTLTMIMHLLEAVPAVQDSVGIPGLFSSRFRYDVEYSFGMVYATSEFLPSQQFIQTLRAAGLEAWLTPTPNSGSLSDLSKSSAHYEYLSKHENVLRALQILTWCVNRREYHRLHPATSTPSPSTVVPMHSTPMTFFRPDTRTLASSPETPGQNVMASFDEPSGAHAPLGLERDRAVNDRLDPAIAESQTQKEAVAPFTMDFQRATAEENAALTVAKPVGADEYEAAEEGRSSRESGRSEGRTLERGRLGGMSDLFPSGFIEELGDDGGEQVELRSLV